MGRKTAKIIILMGITIAAVPFLLRMQGQQRAGEYISQLEENKDEENEKMATVKRRIPHIWRKAPSGLWRYRN